MFSCEWLREFSLTKKSPPSSEQFGFALGTLVTELCLPLASKEGTGRVGMEIKGKSSGGAIETYPRPSESLMNTTPDPSAGVKRSIASARSPGIRASP